MIEIDWSKAPEGASHFCNGDWFKKEDGKWCYWFDGARSWTEAAYADPANFSWWGLRIERPSPAWIGEGRAPVGIVCEVWFDDGRECWHEAEVIHHKSDDPRFAAARLRGAHHDRLEWVNAFRPIRTPEQIAADERENAITDMCVLLGKDPKIIGVRERAGILYDAGYRKQADK